MKRMAACAVLFSAFLLGGCVRKYTRGEIRAYAMKETGRSGIEVADGYREIQEDEEGYLDHLWEVTDKESGIVFHVLDDYFWSMEKVHNELKNDFDACAYLALLEAGELPRPENLSLRKTEESGLVKVQLLCGFKDLAELEACHESLLEQRRILEENGFTGDGITYVARYENPLRRAIDFEIDEGDTDGSLGSVGEESLALMRSRCLACALDYRFEDALAEFGREEIEAMVQDPRSVRIYRKQADGQGGRRYYEGLTASPKFAGISFGTLFEILVQDGMEPKGDSWHYSFTGADGSSYEISYDFNDLSGFNDSRGRLRNGYYYIRDGKKVRMGAFYENHFDASRVSGMTGVGVAEERPHQR